MTRTVHLVTGPPCAGKTTHVTQHAQPGDLILDADELGEAEYQRQLRHVAAMTTGTAWVIRCCPGPTARAAFAEQIGATSTVHLKPDREQLLARARRRPNPRRAIQAVRHWHDVEAGRTPARTNTDPEPTPRTRW